jgi:hypothetical protein
MIELVVLPKSGCTFDHPPQTDLSGVIAKEYAAWFCAPTLARISPNIA